MSKKLYDVTVYNTNSNIVNYIVIGGRIIHGKSKTEFKKIGDSKFTTIKNEVLKNSFARMSVIEYNIGKDGGDLQKKDLSETELKIRKLLNAGKFDDAKLLIDKLNSMKKNLNPTQMFDNPEDLNNAIINNNKDNGNSETEDNKDEDNPETEDNKDEDNPETNDVVRDIDSFSKKELIDLAKNMGVEIKSNDSKKTILKKLKNLT